MTKYFKMTLMAQAAGGSATIALGTGVIADISLPHERGKFVGVFQFAGTFSTASESCPFNIADTDPHSWSSIRRCLCVYTRLAFHFLVSDHLLRCRIDAHYLVSLRDKYVTDR
jgi:MFS family permease